VARGGRAVAAIKPRRLNHTSMGREVLKSEREKR